MIKGLIVQLKGGRKGTENRSSEFAGTGTLISPDQHRAGRTGNLIRRRGGVAGGSGSGRRRYRRRPSNDQMEARRHSGTIVMKQDGQVFQVTNLGQFENCCCSVAKRVHHKALIGLMENCLSRNERSGQVNRLTR